MYSLTLKPTIIHPIILILICCYRICFDNVGHYKDTTTFAVYPTNSSFSCSFTLHLHFATGNLGFVHSSIRCGVA